jgi:hypothetical protein
MVANGCDELIIELLRHGVPEQDSRCADIDAGSLEYCVTGTPGADGLAVAKSLLQQDKELDGIGRDNAVGHEEGIEFDRTRRGRPERNPATVRVLSDRAVSGAGMDCL